MVPKFYFRTISSLLFAFIANLKGENSKKVNNSGKSPVSGIKPFFIPNQQFVP